MTHSPRALALVLALVSSAACARPAPPAAPAPAGGGADSESASPAPAPAAIQGDSAVARGLVEATAPAKPLRLVFKWALQDRDARFSGQGVARVAPPYRARLDLFGPRGEGYVSAAVVGDELRLPPAAGKEAGMLPPPALLWTVMGVLRPPADARLTGSARSGQETRLEYARGGERWRFTFVAGKLRRAELDGAGPGRQTVELRGTGPLGLPASALYRDYAAFRELTLTLDRADDAESFPPDTWTPGGL